MLARTIEEAGLSTVTVTMMPGFAERAGTPRIVGVEFPFGHPMGLKQDREMQMRVLRAALRSLDSATAPNQPIHLDHEWPVTQDIAYKSWQPSEPSPIIGWFREQVEARRRAEEESAG